MPVRKIPKNHLVVTGRYASAKTNEMMEFESLLEKEYMLLLDFDPLVDHYDVQPVCIPVQGVPKGYTVDLAVHYLPEANRPTELVEIKPQEYLDKYESLFAPKFNAATQYCLERGWRFAKYTEIDIRTPRLRNLKFLRPYQNHSISEEQREQVQSQMTAAGGRSTSERLLKSLGPDERETWLPVIWHMLSTGELATDLNEMPVDVPLWTVEPAL